MVEEIDFRSLKGAFRRKWYSSLRIDVGWGTEALIQIANRNMMLKPYRRQEMLHRRRCTEAGDEYSWLLEYVKHRCHYENNGREM